MANPFESAGYKPAGKDKPNPFAAAGFEAAQHDQMTHKHGFEAGTSADLFGGPKGESIYGPTAMEPGYDYYSGVPDAGVRYDLSRGDNKEEQAAALEKKFGKNVFQDKFGNWLVKPEGFKQAGMKVPEKATAVIPKGGDRRSMADYAGGLIPVAGGVAAAALAPATGGTSLAIGAGMAGAAGTKALDEIIKMIQGFHRKTTEETVSEPAKEGLMFGAGDIGGRALVGAKGLIAGGASPMSSAASKESFKDAAAHGYTPSLSQAIPGLRLMSREQTMAHRVFSDPAVTKNVEALTKEIEGFLKKSGTPEAEMPEAMQRIVTASTKDEKFGKLIVQTLQRTRSGMELEAKKSREQAKASLSQTFGQVEKVISDKGFDSNIVKQSVADAQAKFSETAANEYGVLDQIAGEPIVLTQPLKDAAAIIEKRRQEGGNIISDEVGSLIKRIKAMPEKVTVRGMQYDRSRFGEAWYPMGPLKGMSDAERAMIYNATNDAFSATRLDLERAANPKEIEQRIIAGRPKNESKLILPEKFTKEQEAARTTVHPDELAAAVSGENAMRTRAGSILKQMKEVDTWYGDNIKKFENVQAQALLKTAGERGAVDPGQVVDYLIKPGKGEQLGRVLKLLTPEARQNLAGAHFKSLMKESSDVGGEVNSKALRKRVTEMGPMLEQVYGKSDAALIRKYSDMLAAYNGHLNPRELGGTHFAQILENAVRKEQAVESFMKDNYLSELSKGGAEATKAVDYIVQPNHPERARQAVKFFGENSKEVQNIRQQTLQRMFSEMFLTEQRGGAKTTAEFISGKELQKVMKEYGNPTMEAVFGKQTLNDLTKFASRIEYVTRKGGAAGELVSSNLALNWWKHKAKLLTIYATSNVMARPGFMKYMVLGMDEPTSAAGRAANKMVNEALMDAARGMPFCVTPPFDKPTAQPGAKQKIEGFMK